MGMKRLLRLASEHLDHDEEVLESAPHLQSAARPDRSRPHLTKTSRVIRLVVSDGGLKN